MRKVILYIASSVDGYIAKPGDDLSFLRKVEKEGEDYGYKEFISNVDTVLLGRRTYDWLMNNIKKYPHTDKESYVITSKERPSEGNLHFSNEDPAVLLERLKEKEGKNIFIDGGATLVHHLLKNDLIDEIIISVIPVLLGDGIRLFKDGRPSSELLFREIKHYETGLVQLHYVRAAS